MLITDWSVEDMKPDVVPERFVVIC